jgi:hypothetical protein
MSLPEQLCVQGLEEIATEVIRETSKRKKKLVKLSEKFK